MSGIFPDKPRFSEYVLARLIAVAVGLSVLFVAALILLDTDSHTATVALLMTGTAMIFFGIAIYRGAKQIEKKLERINTYLTDFDTLESSSNRTHFFTREFETLNYNLFKTLKKAKKREDIKQRYNAKLKLKNRQRADMISAIAHEFRNPVAAIMGYSQTLHEDPHIPPALQEKFLEKIYRNGNKIEALLGRLVLWNKFESGETTLHKSRFDLVALAEDVRSALLEKYKGREVSIEGSRCIVEADRTLIEVVLKNLVENALKYSKGTVEVTVGTDSSVAVKDFGTGIPEKDLTKITKKFYRAGTHTWDNSMGLGLSIVKTILKLHGSSLHIQSKLHEGSCFSFALPPLIDE